MRYLMIMALVLPTACGFVRGDNKAPEPQPETVSEAAAVDLPDSDATEAASDSGATGLTGATRTVAGLGDPSRPGLWLETPLVQAKAPGRVSLASGGPGVTVTLLPAPGEATAGSRLSLEAMRALGAPLAELVELEVSPAG